GAPSAAAALRAARAGRHENGMRVEALTILAASAAVVVMVAALAPRAIHAQPSSPMRGLTVRELRSPSAFASIADPAARSAALFVEAGNVLQPPRCLNCHSGGDPPSHGTDSPHQPPLERGADGF